MFDKFLTTIEIDLQFFHAGSQSLRLRHGASARAQLGTLVAFVYVSRCELVNTHETLSSFRICSSCLHSRPPVLERLSDGRRRGVS